MKFPHILEQLNPAFKKQCKQRLRFVFTKPTIEVG